MNTRKQWSLPAVATALALLFPAFAGATYPAEVPRTGQTSCYGFFGTTISCEGTGQDGELLAGVAWPDPRFTDTSGGAVLDNLTGLEWAKDANLMVTRDPAFDNDSEASNGMVTWQHALDYVAKLNNESYLGYTDWRLPNVNELSSLVDAGQYSPALPQGHPFANIMQPGYKAYWSSTSYAEYAWSVSMVSGSIINRLGKADKACYVWPVRAGQCGASGNPVICLPKTGQRLCYNDLGTEIDCTGTGQDGELQAGVAWPEQRFAVQSDNQTVVDNLTGLMWARNANLMVTRDPAFDFLGEVNDGKVTWQQALSYVAKLNNERYLGYADWRLPNIRELRSLVDYNRVDPALPQGHPFTNVPSDYYASSTTHVSSDSFDRNTSWRMDISGGIVLSGDKYGLADVYVWPVRAGQAGNSTTVCPAVQVLGVDNPNLESLRDFRDSKLANSFWGLKIIEIYYNNAPGISAALNRSPELRAFARRALETIASLVGRKE